MSRKKGKQRAFLKTAEEYSSCTTIHGVSYAFDRDSGVLDRILWTLVVVALLVFAVYLNYNIWTQWRDGQVEIIIQPMRAGPKGLRVESASLKAVTGRRCPHSARCSCCQLRCSGSQNLPCSIYRRIICSCRYYLEHPKILLLRLLEQILLQ